MSDPTTKRRTHGCCDDRACTPDTCMELPSGVTCGDCVHVERCCTIYGHIPGDTYCDWFPRRFCATPESPSREQCRDAIRELQRMVHCTAASHGWHDAPNPFPQSIALMHSELSEALEWWRNEDGPSDHIPPHTGIAEEMADVVIRVLDTCHEEGIDLGAALLAKMTYNDGRPQKHGGKLI